MMADDLRRPAAVSAKGRRVQSSDDIEQLAQQAAAGDAAALDRLLRMIEPGVLRRCSRFLPYRQDAEEACQDALLQVARGIPSFGGRSKFSTWLYVIVGNCARRTYRSLRRRAGEQMTADTLEARPDPRTTSVIAGSRIDLLDALDKLEGVRPELLAPLVLRELSGLPYAEIAEHLRLPLGTVKAHIHEGRKIVKQHLMLQS
jgi:RNA polymerase sigma factor (sigma-70 family)